MTRNERIRVIIYLTIILSGSALLVFLSLKGGGSEKDPLFIGFFTLLSLALMMKPIAVDTTFQYTLEDVIAYGVVFLKGVTPAVQVFFLSSFLYELLRLARAWRIKKGNVKPFSILVNFGNPFMRILIVGPAGLTYEMIKGRLVTPQVVNLFGWEYIAAYSGCVFVFFILSSFFGTILLSSRSGLSIKNTIATWKDSWKAISPHLLMLAPLGILMSILYQKSPYATVLLVVPVYIMHTAIEAIRSILGQSLNTIEFMADTLDQRDAYTYGHSERVSRYSAAIGERMGMGPDQVEKIRKAGLIHDLGKITIPDRVLRKESGLDDNEYSVMKSHTHVPAVLFRSFSILSKEIPLQAAMYHHERYDGEGYIFGLKGEQIPLVARILAVADTYDAITSDRPYRDGLSEEEARRRIAEVSGTQLDPGVVEIFLKMSEEEIFSEIRREYNETVPEKHRANRLTENREENIKTGG